MTNLKDTAQKIDTSVKTVVKPTAERLDSLEAGMAQLLTGFNEFVKQGKAPVTVAKAGKPGKEVTPVQGTLNGSTITLVHSGASQRNYIYKCAGDAIATHYIPKLDMGDKPAKVVKVVVTW